MKSTVVICCYNSAKLISDALLSVFDQSGVHRGDVQVVVVDNNCTDETVAIARSVAERRGRTVEIVEEHTPGLIHARRAGALAARHDFVCFVDDDNRLDPDYLRRAASVFARDASIGYVGGRSRLPDGQPVPDWLTADLLVAFAVGEQYADAGRLDGARPMLWGAGLCCLTGPLQHVLADLDGFTLVGRVGSQQFAGDDSELCYRLAFLGFHAFYDPAMTFVHAIDPARFSVERVLKMFAGFGSAKPTLDTFECRLALKRRRGRLGRLLLLWAPVRWVAYSLQFRRRSFVAESVANSAWLEFYRHAVQHSRRSAKPVTAIDEPSQRCHQRRKSP